MQITRKPFYLVNYDQDYLDKIWPSILEVCFLFCNNFSCSTIPWISAEVDEKNEQDIINYWHRNIQEDKFFKGVKLNFAKRREENLIYRLTKEVRDLLIKTTFFDWSIGGGSPNPNIRNPHDLILDKDRRLHDLCLYKDDELILETVMHHSYLCLYLTEDERYKFEEKNIPLTEKIPQREDGNWPY